MKAKSVRGVYEHPAGSGVWWIHYYVNGKRHREKAGRKSDAIALYQKRKADARRKLKLPELVPGKTITFGHLSEMAVTHAETHLKSIGHYKTKDSILREPFGERPAAAITPQEIDDWLTKHCKTPATANRYRVFLSLAYRLGMENGKRLSGLAMKNAADSEISIKRCIENQKWEEPGGNFKSIALSAP